MALSGIVSKGLAGKSVGNPFSRSASLEDLTSAPPVSKDAIQVFLSAPGKVPPVRMLSTDTISSVNLRLKTQGRGFYSRNNCILSGSSSYNDICLEEPSTNSMRFILGVADLLFVNVSTFSGKVRPCSL